MSLFLTWVTKTDIFLPRHLRFIEGVAFVFPVGEDARHQLVKMFGVIQLFEVA